MRCVGGEGMNERAEGKEHERKRRRTSNANKENSTVPALLSANAKNSNRIFGALSWSFSRERYGDMARWLRLAFGVYCIIMVATLLVGWAGHTRERERERAIESKRGMGYTASKGDTSKRPSTAARTHVITGQCCVACWKPGMRDASVPSSTIGKTSPFEAASDGTGSNQVHLDLPKNWWRF